MKKKRRTCQAIPRPKLKPCGICGALPARENPDFLYVDRMGLETMSIDDDLCIECAVILWRNFRDHYRPLIAPLEDFTVFYEAIQQGQSGDNLLKAVKQAIAAAERKQVIQ